MLARVGRLASPATLSSNALLACRHGITPSSRARLAHQQYRFTRTLGFSAIFTAAGAIDVGIKRRRRKQWDDCIQTARSQLDEDDSAPVRDATEIKEPSSVMAHPSHVTKDSLAPALTPVAKSEAAPAQLWRTGQDSSAIALRNSSSGVLAPTASDVQPLAGWLNNGRLEIVQIRRLEGLVRRSLERPFQTRQTSFWAPSKPSMRYSFESDQVQADPSMPYWTPRKILTMELAMAKLATSLLLDSYPVSANADTSVSSRHGFFYPLNPVELRRRVARLSGDLETVSRMADQDLHKIESPQLPTYVKPQPAHNESASSCAQSREAKVALTRAMLTIFQKLSQGIFTLENAIAKTAYNLLMFTVAPSITTMTLLVSRLSALNHHSMVDKVVEATLQSTMRVDGMFINSVLTHYMRKGDVTSFAGFIKKMEGSSGGLNLAHPNVRHAQFWRGKSVQVFDKDLPIYRTLIRGYLQFGLFTQGVQTYRDMRVNSIEPDLGTMTPFLVYFARQKQWSMGYAMWRKMCHHHLSYGPPTNSITRREQQAAFAAMLRLCRTCQRPAEYDEISQQASARSLSIFEGPDIYYPPETRFSRSKDTMKSTVRKAAVIERKCQVQLDQFQRLAMEVLASKIVLSGNGRQVVEGLRAKIARDQHPSDLEL
ncbi:MAG: hypothetical protein M1828_000721 [Chrysothrix sp. TS-e1954]|nr:MAG: hypothetical protein M1828_000721 [Chrysothrix sp. TS-e1954]